MKPSSDNSTTPNEQREDLNYPASPRSQKWISNLLPVLEHYNYNYAEIIQLVKACDYNGDKIQNEVDRIMEVNIGHEQGEWTVVKQPERAKPAATKAAKAVPPSSRKEPVKASVPKETKQQRYPVTVKGSLRSNVKKETKVDTPAEPVPAPVTAPAPAPKVEAPSTTETPSPPPKESQKSATEKPATKKDSETPKKTPAKQIAKDASKPAQSNAKKGFPLKWASLLKTVTTEEEEEEAAEKAVQPPASAAEEVVESTPAKSNVSVVKEETPAPELKQKVESPKRQAHSKAQSQKQPQQQQQAQPQLQTEPKPQNDIDAITLAQAEEALKKLEFCEEEKAEEASPIRSPVPPPAQPVVEEVIPVLMPKPLSAGIDATLMFGCFEEETQKPSTWTQTSAFTNYQQPTQTRREYGKYSRTTQDLRAENAVSHNLLHHETDPLAHHDVGRLHHDPNDTLHVDSSHMQESTHQANFPAQWQMGYYGSRYSNTKQQAFTYGYDEDKHKVYRQGANDHYGQKDSRHHMNGIYFNYGYQPERLQNPPGLLGFYTPQQPYYGFPNSGTQANPPGASDSMASMWRT